MSDDYRITLAVAVGPSELLDRMSSQLPRPLPEPTVSAHGWSFGFRNTHCLALFLGIPRENDFVGGLSDEGEWEWEPTISTSLSISPYETDEPTNTKLASLVARLLETGPEDLSFTYNGNYLLLIRKNGLVTKHNRTGWWNHHPEADAIVAG